MVSTSYSRSLPRPASKVSFKDPSAFDLFYQLTYMSAVASAGISRGRIFQLAARVPRAPGEYFRRIHLLCEKLGYNYPSACNTVGQRAKSEAMKTFLLRFADALSSGHPELSFLAQEAKVQRDAYEKEYERNLASLTKWTDAYGALVVSASLIIIVNLTSSLVYDLGVGMTITLIATAVLTIAGGAWIISRAAPSEPEAVFTMEGPPLQRLVLRLVKVLPATLVACCLILGLLRVGLGWILIVAGLLFLPLGIVAVRATREIDRKDAEIGPFLRSFGAMVTSTTSTLSHALTQIDLDSFPNLQPDMRRLDWRLKASVPPSLCWRQFALETGSRLISETISIFNDAIELGGEADTVGALCSDFATTGVMLRARRKVLASTFSWLTVMMHTVVSALMLIILEVIQNFSEVIVAAAHLQEGMNLGAMQLPVMTFGSPMLGPLAVLTRGMVVVLCVINAFAIVAADGGHILKGAFYLAILLALSGVGFLVAPPLVDAILKVG